MFRHVVFKSYHKITPMLFNMQIRKPRELCSRGFQQGCQAGGRCPIYSTNYSVIPALKLGRERLIAEGIIRPLLCVKPASGEVPFGILTLIP